MLYTKKFGLKLTQILFGRLFKKHKKAHFALPSENYNILRLFKEKSSSGEYIKNDLFSQCL